MPLKIVKSDHFLTDAENQFRWYLHEAGLEVADRYLAAVDETLVRLARHPLTGRRRRFRDPRIAGFRSHVVSRPFNRHVLFYQVDDEVLHVRRVMDGSRDLAPRLAQPPSAED